MKISNISSDESEFDMKELKRSLVIENDFLVKLVDTIPAKMYFDSEIQEKITADKHLTMDKAVEGNFTTAVVFHVSCLWRIVILSFLLKKKKVILK